MYHVLACHTKDFCPSTMPAPKCLSCGSYLGARWGKTPEGGTRPRAEWQCPYHGTVLRCALHCPGCVTARAGGPQWGGAPGRSASAAPAAAASAPPPPAPPAAPAPAAADALPADAAAADAPAAAARGAQLRARSRSRSGEGRLYRRETIARRLLAQWRFLDEAERPLPPPGRADSGLVGYGTWGGALQDERQLTLTRELLRSERWRNEGAHSSVHLTLFLAWAEERLRRREGERLAGLEIGRAIQRFLPR